MTRPKNKAAEAARLVKKDILARFPKLGVSVRSEYYATGESKVSVILLPCEPMVEESVAKEISEIISKYKKGYFEGLDDSYKYTNLRSDIPQVYYLGIYRKLTEAQEEIRRQEYAAAEEKRIKERGGIDDDGPPI